MVHIYEYTTQSTYPSLLSCCIISTCMVSVTPSMKIESVEKGVVPVQIIFWLKEQSQKKINSHRCFFNAFKLILQPNVCVLLNVGTMPGPTSVYHLWKAFDINSNVGGACGEIVSFKGKYRQYPINPLVAAQNFEYKMSNILDKTLESVFWYIIVRPGAFSAYCYIALQNDTMGEGPLQKYFLAEKMHGAGTDIFTTNMYLAEDQVSCVQVPLLHDFSLLWTIDIMLGIGLETWGIVDVALCQVCLCCHRGPWSGIISCIVTLSLWEVKALKISARSAGYQSHMRWISVPNVGTDSKFLLLKFSATSTDIQRIWHWYPLT